MKYGIRSSGTEHGLVFTKTIVVDKMLDMVGYIASNDLSQVKILEPSAGEGAFAISIITRLYESALKFKFDFASALQNVIFFELDEKMVKILRERIQEKFSSWGLDIEIPEKLITLGDFLMSKDSFFNVIVGNPPYVRHENIPEIEKIIYRQKFRTFTHRSDLYIAFFEKCLRMLQEKGTLAFICSNRWLKNQYGRNLRTFIGNHFTLDCVIDLEEAAPFEEAVMAYPAISIIKKSKQEEKTKYFRIADVQDLAKFSKEMLPIRTLNLQTTNWFSVINIGSAYEKNVDTIDNQGFRIGIGVATGCDKVFIRDDFKQFIEEELLIPILTSKDLKDNKVRWSGNYILNPFTASGSLINLDLFPHARDYFQSQQDILMQRHISKKNAMHWYRTIDKINIKLVPKEKLLLPDISGNSHLFIDKGSFYPHHNLYYITGGKDQDLVLLAAILMSDFVKKQLLEFGNKMNGGYPRWQSQNLKKIRIPVLSSIPLAVKERLLNAYHRSDIDEIDALINLSEISTFKASSGQINLF